MKKYELLNDVETKKSSNKHKSKLNNKRKSDEANQWGADEEYLHQQMLGNAHLKKLPIQQFSELEQQVLQEFKLVCYIENKNQLWQQFATLTPGQQRVFLVDVFGLTKAGYQLPEELNWLEWEKHLKRMASVPLEQEEAYKEQKEDATNAYVPFFEMKVEQFTSPYREIWTWLNYKGNQQNQVSILRRLEQLPLDHKKWLLHKLVEGDKITAHAFATQLTIIVHEQTRVDWDRIVQQLEHVNAKSKQEIDEELKQLNSTKGKPDESTTNLVEEDMMEEDDAHIGLLALTSLLDDSSGEQSNRLSIIEQWCKSAEQISLLLFGHQQNQKEIKNIKKLELIVFVDKLLMLADQLKGNQRKQKREQQIKACGFLSAADFAKYCIEQLARILYEQGIIAKQEKYKAIIFNLGFSITTLPSEEQLVNKLKEMYLG